MTPLPRPFSFPLCAGLASGLFLLLPRTLIAEGFVTYKYEDYRESVRQPREPRW